MSKILFEENKLGETTLEINWEAVKNNIHYFKKELAPETLIMLMVKASAYGNGAIGISKMAQQDQLADYFGVVNIDEGIELRNTGIETPIMVQNPSSSDWKDLIDYGLEPEIHSIELLRSFSLFMEQNQALEIHQLPIHLKFNTGMNRLGIDREEMEELTQLLDKPHSWQIRSVMTHLSSTGIEAEDEFTQTQLKEFEEIQKSIQAYLKETTLFHALNTDGVARHTAAQLQMVRLGIGIYGCSTSPSLKKELQPATTLKTKVISSRRVQKGASISYSRSGKAEADCNIAVLSIGYADGFPIRLGNGQWEFEVDGKLYPTIGVVCMDLCMINLGNDEVEVGTEVIVYGGKRSIFDYANAMGTVPYEAMTSLSSRVKKIIVEN